MTNFDGYTESTSTTNARAWRTALQSQKLAAKLNTEDEADRVRDFITCAELNDARKVDPRTPAQIEADERDIDWNQQVSEYRGG